MRHSSHSSHTSAESNDWPTHVREGAFEPSTSPSTDSASPQDLTIRIVGKDVDPIMATRSQPVVTSPAVLAPPDDLLDETISISPAQKSWISLSQALSEGPTSSRSSFDEARPLPPSGSFAPASSGLRGKKEGAKDELRPSLAATGVKGALTNLKRFSTLPRTPSVSSKAPSVEPKSASPSPPVAAAPLPPAPRPPRPKIRSNWPSSMSCRDVVVLPTALERSLGYAHKINDLAKYDCGLGDWVVYTKQKGQHLFSTRLSMCYSNLTLLQPCQKARPHDLRPSVLLDSRQGRHPSNPDMYLTAR